MKRKLLCILLATALTFLFAFSLYASEKEEAVEEKPTIVFWQIEKDLGFGGWFDEVVADINANEDFTVEIKETMVGQYFELAAAYAVSQSGFDFGYEWAGQGNCVLRGKGGLYQPLNDLIPQSIIDDLNPSITAASTDESGNIWGVPLINDPKWIIFNREVLEHAGIDIERAENEIISWDEFLDWCEQIKRSGKIPIAYYNKEGFMAELWHMNMTHQWFDRDEDLIKWWWDADWVGDPIWNDICVKYKELWDKEYFYQGGETLAFGDHYYGSINSGDVAFLWYFNSKYQTIVEQGLGYGPLGFMHLPMMGPGKLKNIMPTLGYTFSISKWTKYPKQCVKAIEYMTSKKWQKILLTKWASTPAHLDITVTDAEFEKLAPNIKYYFKHKERGLSLVGYQLYTGRFYDDFTRSMVSYINGEISVDELAEISREAALDR
ncbi:MAG: carbohydrate ABC transporter substrate-binding protein [Spirochaetota bacterium]|nr:MAG: carbohydrate ABC transporter substrate-binding protein [Spirochaetota bacterium]